MAGIIFSQLYWVKLALDLKNEQFDNSVRIATKGIVNEFQGMTHDSIFNEHIRLLQCRKNHLELTDYMDSELLDSLLISEFNCMNIRSKYYYGVYNKGSGKFVSGNFSGYKEQIKNSDFQFSLKGIYKPGNYYLGIYFPNTISMLVRKMSAMIIFSSGLLIVLVASFIFVIYTLFWQKRLSEVKNDFINNLTHEFKTPIATTSLAAEMLVKENISNYPDKVKRYAGVILYENKRLQSQVEQILQIARFEKGTFSFKQEKLDVHQLIDNIMLSFELRIEKSKALVTTSLEAKNYIVNTDSTHITNVIYNLLDNAFKYSPRVPEIKISTRDIKKGIIISVEDKGVGIAKKYQNDIFKNLFRIPTGNLHEVRGFGLGLYYSKYVVESLGGEITVESEAGKGSIFAVSLPHKRIKKV